MIISLIFLNSKSPNMVFDLNMKPFAGALFYYIVSLVNEKELK